jgi:hypothetical protein
MAMAVRFEKDVHADNWMMKDKAALKALVGSGTCPDGAA